MRRVLVSVLGIAIAALASGCSLSVPSAPVRARPHTVDDGFHVVKLAPKAVVPVE